MKNLPPSTPTPRRFMVAKRAAQSSTSTPGLHSQFQSTPQFTSTSVPRPTQWRDAGVEDVDEDDETPADENFAGYTRTSTQDSIDIDSDTLTESHEIEVDSENYEPNLMLESDAELSQYEHFSPEGRKAKRRRLFISPADESSPLTHRDAWPEFASRGENEDLDDTPNSAKTDSDEDIEAAAAIAESSNQPVFQPPPRFKLADSGVAGDDEDLRAAMSLQRSGAQYLPDGLATGLQSWLSELRGWDSPFCADGSTLHVIVDKIRPSRRMCLVQSRPRDGEKTRRFILAGQGRPTGLDKSAAMTADSGVVIGQPRWDVDLDGEVWTVACDWAVT